MAGILVGPLHVCHGHAVGIGVQVAAQDVVAVLVAGIVYRAHEPLLHVAAEAVGSFADKCIPLQAVLIAETVNGCVRFLYRYDLHQRSVSVLYHCFRTLYVLRGVCIGYVVAGCIDIVRLPLVEKRADDMIGTGECRHVAHSVRNLIRTDVRQPGVKSLCLEERLQQQSHALAVSIPFAEYFLGRVRTMSRKSGFKGYIADMLLNPPISIAYMVLFRLAVFVDFL